MNPELISFKKNRRYIIFAGNKHDSHQKNQSFPEILFKNPKTEHYLRVLDDCGIHRSVIEHMSVFFQYLTRRNRRITTIMQYHNAIKRLMLFLESLNIKKIELVKRDDLGAFIEYLQDSDLKSSTINSYLTNLYVVFGFMIEQDVISPDIMRNKFRLKMPDLLPKAIDPTDIRQLISAVNTARERALILILLRTGMRIGELLATKIKDIDLTERKIEIHQASKNYEGRIVYMSDDACKALKTWLRARLPGKDYTFYGSGHRNIEVTRRYARLTDSTRKEEYFKAIEIIERGDVNGHYRFHN